MRVPYFHEHEERPVGDAVVAKGVLILELPPAIDEPLLDGGDAPLPVGNHRLDLRHRGALEIHHQHTGGPRNGLHREVLLVHGQRAGVVVQNGGVKNR